MFEKKRGKRYRWAAAIFGFPAPTVSASIKIRKSHPRILVHFFFFLFNSIHFFDDDIECHFEIVQLKWTHLLFMFNCFLKIAALKIEVGKKGSAGRFGVALKIADCVSHQTSCFFFFLSLFCFLKMATSL